jgi:hypothetical protein
MASLTDMVVKDNKRSKATNIQVLETLKKNEKEIKDLLKKGYSKASIVDNLNKMYQKNFDIVEVYNPRKKKIEKKKPTIYISHLNRYLGLKSK